MIAIAPDNDKAASRTAVERLRPEARHRVLADLKRRCREFLNAIWTQDDGSEGEVVGCSNDYLGQRQKPRCSSPCRTRPRTSGLAQPDGVMDGTAMVEGTLGKAFGLMGDYNRRHSGLWFSHGR